VVDVVEKFAATHNDGKLKFILAAGNAGIDAATNMVIKQSEPLMLALVYGIVAMLVMWVQIVARHAPHHAAALYHLGSVHHGHARTAG
jgi:hypothetical protein